MARIKGMGNKQLTYNILMEQGERERKYLWQQNTLYGMPEEMCYVLTDALNTPIQVTDGGGRTQNAYRYDEFGVPEYRREESPLPFGFTGYLADRAGGLYYANAREYHAGSGRFLTKDLNSYMDLKDPNTLNLYQYVKGNPLKYVDYSGHVSICEKKSYLERTLDMVIYGSFTDEFTWAGLGLQIAAGFTNADIACDIRDFTADITVNKDMTSPAWWGTIVLDVAAFIPVIGMVKYADDAVYGVKMLFKNGDEVIDGGRRIARAADALGDISKKGGTALDGMADSLRGMAKKVVKNADMLNDAKYIDDVADAASDVGKRLDDLADAASDAGKKLDDWAGGGLESVDDIIRDGSQLENGKLKPNVKYQAGEYEYIYQTNEDGLISHASTDNLQLKTHEGRLNHNSNTYGKEIGDHAGHIFGDRFGGSPELDNLVSQAQRVNLSEYKVIENEWAKALEDGKQVKVDININYANLSARPTSFDVTYTIDNEVFFKHIEN